MLGLLVPGVGMGSATVPSPTSLISLRGAFLDPSQPINWDHEINEGLVAEWALTPIPGWRGTPYWADLTLGRLLGGLGNKGSLVNSPIWKGAATRPGGYGSLSFNGTTNYVALPNNPGINLASRTGYAILGWFRTTQTGDNYLTIYSASNPADTYPDCTIFVHTLTGTIAPIIRDDAHTLIFGDSPKTGLNDGNWHHVALVRTNSSNWSLYIDGTFNTGMSAALGTTTVTNFTLGARRRTPTDSYFLGDLDGIALFNRALSAAEVATLYDQSRRGNPDRWRWCQTRITAPAPVAPAAGGVLVSADGTQLIRAGWESGILASSGAQLIQAGCPL